MNHMDASDRISHIIFDIDGTLADTLEGCALCYQEMFASFGIDFDPADYENAFGLDMKSTCEKLQLPFVPEMEPKWMELYPKYAEKNQYFAGMEEVLTSLSSQFTLGIITGRHRHELDDFFGQMHLYDTFSVIITQDDSKRKKPYPDPMFAYCRKAGIKPEEAVYVGDMLSDMDAAKAAGMLCVLATWQSGRKPVSCSCPTMPDTSQLKAWILENCQTVSQN